MSVMVLAAIAFLAAVLVLAEVAWLREEAITRASSLPGGDGGHRRAPGHLPDAYRPRQAAVATTAGTEMLA